MSDMNNPADDNNGAMDDLWAEALSEQKSTSGKSAADAVFQQFGGGDVSGKLQDIDLIMDIPVKLTVELGRTRMTIKELLRLTQGSVVALDGLAGEPLDILINGYLIAQGEVVVVADKYGVRITDIITPSERCLLYTSVDNSALIKQIQQLLQQEPLFSGKPQLRVHPDDLQRVDDMLGATLSLHGWRLRGDPTLHPGGCKVSADEGDLDASVATRWQELCRLAAPGVV